MVKSSILERQINYEKIFPPFPKGVRLCRFCRKPLPGKKRFWCCPEHQLEALAVAGYGGAIRSILHDRDHGVCHDCGLDTQNPPVGMVLRNPNTWNSPWEAHHVIPVAQGGARLGSANCITLCHRCHALRHTGVKNPEPQNQTQLML